jgi:hypothetical protein
MKLRIAWTALLGGAFIGLTALRADEPARADGEPLVVIDAAGKEHKLKTWKFTGGARRLAWLAPKDKPLEGPEALEFREMDSTAFAEGVVTLVPLDRLRTLEYDAKKEMVKLTAATGPKDADMATLNGSTGYQNTNKPTLEGQADKGAEKEKFLCGVMKDGIKSAKFPATKVQALPAGRPAVLTTRRGDDSPTEHKMGDFLPLYRFADGSEVLSPTLYCKTTKIDMAKVIKIERSAGAMDDTVWILSFKKADDETLTLDKSPKIDGKEATLAGFLGRVPAGYKLFPALIIKDVEFDVK